MRKVLKTVGKVVAGLLALAALAIGALYWSGGRHWQQRHELAVETVAVPEDEAGRERGRHLATVHCANCHGDDLGGATFVEDGAFAVVAAPNLTTGEGGAARRYEVADWVRAVRHGLNSRGRAMFVMPAEVYYFLSDDDLGALIAYLESSPPVDRAWPDVAPGPVGRVLRAAGQLDAAFPYLQIDHRAPRPPAPPAGATAEYGEYLTRTFGCTICHGGEFAGGAAPGGEEIFGSNLTPGGPLAHWNEELFLDMVRTRESEHMPWRGLRAMHEEEQRAVWRFLKALPARASVVPAAAAG